MAHFITLKEWDEQNFSKPHNQNTLSKWARNGLIQPQPVLVGRSYQVRPDAEYVPPDRTRVNRIRTASRMLGDADALNDIDPLALEIFADGCKTKKTDVHHGS